MSAAAAIRVLLTSPSSRLTGGVAQYLQILRPHLGDGVTYFTVGSRAASEPAATSFVRVLADSWQFARTLKWGGYDLVHLNPSLGAKALVRDGILLAVAKAQRKEVIVFIHGWDERCVHMLATRLSGLFRLAFGRADAFVVLGNDFKVGLRTLGYDGPVFVHGAPVADELLRSRAQPDANAQANKQRTEFTILFLARIEAAKGIFEALEAFQILQQQFSAVRLLVAGSGSELEKAKACVRARHIEGVSFLGEVHGDAKAAAFRQADAYLFPSHSEGLPISVLEAMANGLPVVTRSVGGLRDFFEDGKMGFITDSRDPWIFASLLSQLIKDPMLRCRMSSFNYVYAREHCAASQIAAQLAGIYRRVFEGAHPALLHKG